MSEHSISLKNVSKIYRVASSPFEKFREMLFPGSVRNAREFVALSELSLSIETGTTLGIIGPNGSGKSTLLKMLAGILEPSTGTINTTGKISSIIELGSGFHPDFTGIENIVLNAALQNIPNSDLPKLIDEITEFTQLGNYMSLPVKTYSSGMFVRLAFAFAVSVQPDILLVDEALAVGDAVFSHKCLARIKKMKDEGATVVFVSHDTGTVSQICDRCILLDKGQVVSDGPTKEVIHQYLQRVAEELTIQKTAAVGGSLKRKFHQVGAAENERNSSLEQRFGNFDAIITDLFLEDCNGLPITRIVSGETARFRMCVQFNKQVAKPIYGIMLKNRFGVELFGTNTTLKKLSLDSKNQGDIMEILFEMPILLGGGTYAASFAVHAEDGQYFDYRVDALIFEVIQANTCGGQLNLPVSISAYPIQNAKISRIRKEDVVFAEAPYELNPSKLLSERFLEGMWFESIMDGHREARWIGEHATAYLRVSPSKHRLIILFSSHKPNIIDAPIKISAFLNEQHIGDNFLYKNSLTELEWNLPEIDQEHIGNFKIVADTWSPSQFGSDDDRTLSILVHNIMLK